MGKSGRPRQPPQWAGGQQHASAHWQLWPGAKSPRNAAWRDQNAPWRDQEGDRQKPAFPTYASRQVPGATPQPIQAIVSETRNQGDGGSMIDGLQQLLNNARKAENRLARANAAQTYAKAQWGVWQEEMKAAWIREQKRYTRDSERRAREIAEAASVQEKARDMVRQAWSAQVSGIPMEVEASAPTPEWDAMVQTWGQEAEDHMGGVLQRALGEATPVRRTAPAMTPPTRAAAAAATAAPSAVEPSPVRTDPYPAPVPPAPSVAASPGPSSHPEGAPVAEGADEPTPRQRPKTPRHLPCHGIKEASKDPTAKESATGSRLGAKLDAVRARALRPFHGAGQNLAPAPEAGVIDLAESAEHEELEVASVSPGFGALDA